MRAGLETETVHTRHTLFIPFAVGYPFIRKIRRAKNGAGNIFFARFHLSDAFLCFSLAVPVPRKAMQQNVGGRITKDEFRVSRLIIARPVD